MLNCDTCFRSSICSTPTIPRSAPGQAHQAAINVLRKPLNNSLELLRRHQRIISRSRPPKNSRLPSGKRVSRRPRVYSSYAAPTVYALLLKAKKRPPLKFRDEAAVYVAAAPHPLQNQHPTDDTAYLHSRYVKSKRSRLPCERHPTMAFSKINNPSDDSDPPPIPPRHPSRTGRYPHNSGGSSSYTLEASIPSMPRRQAPIPRPMRSSVSTLRGSARRKGTYHPDAEPRFREVLRRSLSQQSRVSSILSPLETITASSDDIACPSRTSSQRKALDQFTRQLETFAKLRGVTGKVPVFTPTPETIISYHTVSPLLPYQAEFQQAGLAVTSEEQRARTGHYKRDFKGDDLNAQDGAGPLLFDGADRDMPLGLSRCSASTNGTEILFSDNSNGWDLA